MRSNVCVIKKGGKGLETILAEVEKVTSYNALPKKEALRIRLLAEELTGMLPELVKNFDGVFWMENDGGAYELHAELSVEGMSKERKNALLAVSASGKNAAASGFMGKIREIAENMLLSVDNDSAPCLNYMSECFYDYGADLRYSYVWTLDHYTEQYNSSMERQNEKEWDQLERSIVARLADDVIVGVRGSNVDIIIKKTFG